MRLAALLALVAIASPVLAQDRAPSTWEPEPRVSSAGLGLSGMEQTGTAGWSLPDGRQAVITFWSHGSEQARATRAERRENDLGEHRDAMIYRCLTIFAGQLAQVEERCDVATRPNQ